jgi:hypothetical protein
LSGFANRSTQLGNIRAGLFNLLGALGVGRSFFAPAFLRVSPGCEDSSQTDYLPTSSNPGSHF